MEEITDAHDSTEAFNFEALNEGDTVQVTVEARNGDLKDDETWTETVEFVEKQDLAAQSRKESFKFKDADGRSVYLRFSAKHKNNFGFTMSQEDKSTVDFDAMRQDPITDDREWFVVSISRPRMGLN